MLGVAWYLVSNTLANLEARRIASGFAFLSREAGFEIGEAAFQRYSASDTYLKALAVGLANTFKVSLAGIVLATLLGGAVGLFLVSTNRLLKTVSRAYVEFMRNVPLLVQLFFWYALITETLPPPAGALQPLPGVFLSNRGIFFPLPGSAPVLEGFNFSGGLAITPEFAALLVGLVTYTAAFIAEIVRAGVLSVSRGQFEAACALGLTRGLAMRHVVLPQAFRRMVPALVNEGVTLVKDSSLVSAIGLAELALAARTVAGAYSRYWEPYLFISAIYLVITLVLSALAKRLEAPAHLRGR